MHKGSYPIPSDYKSGGFNPNSLRYKYSALSILLLCPAIKSTQSTIKQLLMELRQGLENLIAQCTQDCQAKVIDFCNVVMIVE